MKVQTVAVLLSAAALVQAVPQGYNYQASGGQGSSSGSGQYPSAPASYNFKWDVNDPPSGNFFGHQETREDANTKGSYYVQLPDSRRLLVEYYADASGYHPTISFEGQPQFPSGPSRGQGQRYSPGGRRPGQGQGQRPSLSYRQPSRK